MTIFEEGTNFPNILGRKTYPHTIWRPTEAPMAVYAGETPIHLYQRFHGQGLRGQAARIMQGRMIGRRLSPYRGIGSGYRHGSDMSVSGDYETLVHGLTDSPVSAGPYENNYPTPYPRPLDWAATRHIASLPSVMGIIPGPRRTVHALSVEL